MIDKTHGNLPQKEKLLGEYGSALRTTQDITSHTIGFNGSKQNILHLYNLLGCIISKKCIHITRYK